MKIFSHIEDYLFQANTLLLTPNRRLANFLRKAYVHKRAVRLNSVALQLELYPLDNFLIRLWQHGMLKFDRYLLSSYEEKILWEEIIVRDPKTKNLLRLSNSITKAMDAFNLIFSHQLEFREENFTLQKDTAIFFEWAKQYQDKLQQGKLLNFAMMVDLIIQYFTIFKKYIPYNIYFVGFDEINPQIKRLINVMQQSGFKVSMHKLSINSYNASKVAFGNEKQEVHTIASYIAKIIATKTTPWIGVVVTNLENRRQEIVNVFNQYIQPSTYDVSAPLPMAHYPMIETALNILRFLNNEIEFNLLRDVITSMFIKGWKQEKHQRAILVDTLQGLMWRDFNINELIYYSKLQPQLSILTTLLTEIKKLKQDMPIRQSIVGWNKVFNKTLAIFHWAEEIELSKNERHLLAVWNNTLNDFMRISNIVSVCDFNNAFGLLYSLMHERPFLPEVTHVSVHVLGMLEAAGMLFDDLFIMSLNRDSWPMEADPNPFIPYCLQKKYKMPRSCPERELEIAKRFTKTFSMCAYNTVFSYPLKVHDMPSGPSALISMLPDNIALQQLSLTEELGVKRVNQAVALEAFQDKSVPYHSNITLNTSTIELQAMCPFKAFASVRLGASRKATTDFGILAFERGKIMHAILAKIYWPGMSKKDIKKFLLNINSIDNIILKELAKFNKRSLNNNFFKLELVRIKQLLLKLFDLEILREDFMVAALEQPIKLNLAGLEFSLRLDRIDQLNSGNKIIIDYKTGDSGSIYDWLKESVTKAQIPLYSLALPNDGVFIIELNNEVLFKGVQVDYQDESTDSTIIANMISKIRRVTRDFWMQQNRVWHDTLEGLALDFASGKAEVKPFDINATCKYCDLKALCRIHAKQELDLVE